jgi:aspartate/methionine/tyrosine aminotransferase
VTSHQAERTRELRPFLAMEVMERAVELEAAGAKVLHLGLGEPDAPPPPAAVEAASRALAEGRTRYTDSRGLRALREAIAADKTARTGVAVDPDRVIVTSGTSPAMLLVFSLLVDPGDEVLVGAPYYPCYPNFVRLCGGTPVAVPCDPEDGFALRAERVKAAITARTRAIVVASPANPTGAVQDAASLRALAELGLPIVSDEIYDGLVYGEARAPSAL